MLKNMFYNKLNILYLFGFVTLASCGAGYVDVNSLIYIKKNQKLDQYLKQNDKIYVKNSYDEGLDNFEFLYNGKKLVCNIVKVATNMDSRTNTSSSGGKQVNTTTVTYYYSKYYVITENDLVVDAFYKYEIVSGLKNNKEDIFDAMNKAYYDYLIKNEVYTKEDIKEMDELEKINKIYLN